MSTPTFEERLMLARRNENKISRWLASRERVLAMVNVYESESKNGFGPRVFTRTDGYVSPDLLGFTVLGAIWFETKQKSVFTWHRITSCWCTGIDLHHYEDYQRVEVETRCPVWLLFLHEQDQPHERDRHFCLSSECPTGLFGGKLSYLKTKENHRHQNWGSKGMVYWAHETLTQFATIDEMRKFD
jgi:hypothetical protein